MYILLYMDLSPFIYASFAGMILVLVSAIGLITLIPALRIITERYLTLLSSFSAGVFLMVSILLLDEVFEDGMSIFPVIFILLGILASFALSLIPEHHHHHYEKNSTHKHSDKSIARILLSSALHNAGDGILLGAAFATSIALGVATTIGVVIHEVLHELSQFFLLRQSGYDIKKAIKWAIITSSAVFIGIALNLLAGDVEKILLGFATGSLFTVVFKDLIPESFHTSKKENRFVTHFLIFFCGSAFMFLLSVFIHH